MFTLVAVPAVGLWLVFGAGVHRYLQTERAWRVFKLTMGATLAGSVLFAFI